MQKEKFISGMNGHIVLSPMERERIIQRSVERESTGRPSLLFAWRKWQNFSSR